MGGKKTRNPSVKPKADQFRWLSRCLAYALIVDVTIQESLK